MKQTLVKKILTDNGIVPISLLKGDPEMSFGLPVININKLYKKDTLVYLGKQDQKEVIIKMTVNNEYPLSRFNRECYVYKNLRKYPSMMALTVAYITSGLTPFPYLIIEKAKGKTIGSWYELNVSDFQLLKAVVDGVSKVHDEVHLPGYMSYRDYNSFSLCLKKKDLMRSNIKLLPKQISKNLFDTYLKTYYYLKDTWDRLPSGFIFQDLQPSNIIASDEDDVKIVDLEKVSTGKKIFDLSYLYFTTIGTKVDTEFYTYLTQNRMKDHKLLLDFMVVYHTLNRLQDFKKLDADKKKMALEKEIGNKFLGLNL